MAGKSKSFLSNVPPLVKLGLISGGIIIAVIIYVAMSGNDTPTIDSVKEVSGQSTIALSVASETTSTKASESNIPSGSDEEKLIKELKQEVIENARSSNTSFVEELELSNNKKIIEELDTRILNNSNVTGLTTASQNSRLAQEQERLKLLEKRAAASNRAAMNANISTSDTPSQSDILAREKAAAEQDILKTFLDSELSKSPPRYGSQSIGSTVSEFSNSRAGGVSVSSGSSASKAGSKKEATGFDGLRDQQRASANRKLDQLKDLRELTASLSPSGKAQSQSGGDALPVDASGSRDPTIDNAPKGPYISAGDMFYSVLQFSVNTDQISPVRAVIVEEGPLKGGVLIGIPQRQGTSVVIKFSNMALNGKDHSVNVVALDPDTMKTALADDVDHHTFERYFKLATAAALSGYAEALTQRRTVTRSDGSTEDISDGLPDAKDQAAFAVGRVGETLVPIYEKEFSRPPTVTVNGNNRDLGIMFMSGLQL